MASGSTGVQRANVCDGPQEIVNFYLKILFFFNLNSLSSLTQTIII